MHLEKLTERIASLIKEYEKLTEEIASMYKDGGGGEDKIGSISA